MRDLAERLRSIVRQDHGGAAVRRELTYVPDGDAYAGDPGHAARLLGGEPLDERGGCVVIDRVWQADAWHGRRPVGSFMAKPEAPIGLFDARAASAPSWAERVVFFDLETTGLSGGAGTLAFLAGCAWFEDGNLRVRQFFLTAPAGERAMLDALARVFDEATLLVTFNGRTFDIPLMETRWAFHRTAAPTDDLPHFDMLPPARRLWGRRSLRDAASDETVEPSSCSLSALERSVLGFHRIGDVPGFEIPARYFHFLRTGDGGVINGVLDHNRHDLVSLAGVMARALALAEDGPDACHEGIERLALGRLYAGAGQTDRARLCFERAAEDDDRDVRRHALARLAALLGRAGRHDEAAAAWQQVLDLARPALNLSSSTRGHGPLDPATRGCGPDERATRGRGPHDPLTGGRAHGPLERRALEALAIHHEHRARDLAAARQYADGLSRTASGRARQDAAHRLGRIDRKLKGKDAGHRLFTS